MEVPNPNIPASPDLQTTVTAYQIPLSAIALWPPANYEHPERRFGLAPFAFFMQILTTVVLAGRIWARLTRRAGTFGADDVLIIFAWLFGTAFTAVSIYGIVDGGFDRHVWDVEQSLVVQAGFAAWAAEGLFLFSSSLTKISILLFYRRLVDRSCSKRMKKLIYGLIGLTVAYVIVFGAPLLLSCQPIASAWLSLNIFYAVPYQCISRKYSDTLAGVISVISDAYVLAIPEVVVYRLKLQRRKKIVLFALFGSGAIVVGAGIARTVWLSRLHTDSRRDLTWIAYELVIWTTIEMQGNIICASAPALKALVSAYFVEVQGDKPLESLIGHIGSYDSKSDANSSDWPLGSNAKNDMEKPMALISEKPIWTEEKPPTPPKDDIKGWEDGMYGGITVTERYSVVSADPFPLGRGDGSKKGRKVLGC